MLRDVTRRTKMENVSVEFKDDTYGVMRGTFVAEGEADTYGADKFWMVLKPIPINLEEDQGDEQSGSPADILSYLSFGTSISG